LKVRKQNASPCFKKGIDNYKVDNLCEFSKTCKLKGDFNNPDSKLHQVCIETESYLTENNLIRYELREMSGLEILFQGIEKIYNLNSEIYNDDRFEGIGPNDLTQMSMAIDQQNSSALKKDKLIQKEDYLNENQKIIMVQTVVSLEEDETSILNHLPENLGLAQTFSHDLLSTPPRNLFDSIFQSLFLQGVFEPQFIEIKNETKEDRRKRELIDDDFNTVATIMFHGLEDKQLIKQFWPRFTEKRYEKNRAKVYETINLKTLTIFKRFNKIWDKLTKAQAQALKLEYFYEELEKTSQKQNAKSLGISIASYQDRLELAYKKLEKLYPELVREPRRKPRRKSPPTGQNLTEKNLSPSEKVKLMKWARQKSDAYLQSLKRVTYNYVVIEKEGSNSKQETVNIENDQES
tara:strand:+ start:3494 stop:4711 length:1218 start_codon:yes stop_codon:yes gene_type:complete